ncbi:hypothetical protein OF83DRAFT_1167247 [Amylostereum chailletii]|nr:hypothetical protein OF83DRAFT_1167247 [Amylostereum chailletii]
MTIRRETSSLLSEPDKSPAGLPVRPPRKLPRGGPFKPPFEYSNDMADLSFWDVQFMTRIAGGLTLVHFDKPPPTVLTIGCGLGLWTVNAAHKWPHARFYGHDPFGASANIARVLPLIGLSDRVFFDSWSLTDRLPFPDAFFDMVRVSYVSMGLSERQWPPLLEEILRVMKPGAWAEVCPVAFKHRTHMVLTEPCRSSRMTSSSRAAPPPKRSSPSSPSLPKNPPLRFPLLSIFTPPTSTSTLSFGGLTAHSGSTPTKFSSHDSYQFPTNLAPLAMQYEDDDPLDHSRLTSAWEEMLSSREIPMQPSSVLPLYLSAMAEDYRALPTLEIHMPEPTETEYPQHPCRGYFDMNELDGARLGTLGPQSIRDTLSSAFLEKEAKEEPSRVVPTDAPMHLARAVQTVRCCKEALWEAYQALFTPEELLQPNLKSVQTFKDSASVSAVKEHPIISLRDRTREAFEHDWFNWETDMTSRIGMRNIVQSRLGWEEPRGELPDWRIWRDRLADGSPSSSSVASLYGSPCMSPHWGVCRALRGFVIWKSKAPPEEAR